MRGNLYDKLSKQPQASFLNMPLPFKGRDFIQVIKGIFPFSSDGRNVDHLYLVID